MSFLSFAFMLIVSEGVLRTTSIGKWCHIILTLICIIRTFLSHVLLSQMRRHRKARLCEIGRSTGLWEIREKDKLPFIISCGECRLSVHAFDGV